MKLEVTEAWLMAREAKREAKEWREKYEEVREGAAKEINTEAENRVE